MSELCIASETELYGICGGTWKDFVTTTVGVCGGVAGGASAFCLGYAAAGNIFTGPISVGAGVVCGAVGAAGGYAGAKAAAEEAWDCVAAWFE